MPSSQSRGRVRPLVLGVTVLLALLPVTAAVVEGTSTYSMVREQADAGAGALEEGRGQLQGLTLENGIERLTRAQADFQRASEAFGLARARLDADPLAGMARYLPGAADELAASADLLTIGGQIGDFARQATGVGRRAVLLTGEHHPTTSPGERAAAFLQAEAATVTALTRTLEVIQAERARIPPSASRGRLGPILVQLDAKLARLVESWKQIAALLVAARFLLGVDATRTYLIVNLDSAELRAAGGYIGSVGLLHISRGKMDRIDFTPIEALGERTFLPGDPAYIPAPLPIARHLASGNLNLRDAAWWPDFPTSAAVIERLLKGDTGATVDGVIGIDPYLVSDLLSMVGGVSVPGVKDPFTAGNFYLKSIFQSGEIGIPATGAKRKDFLGYIGQVLEQRLLALPAEQLGKLSGTVGRACLRRDLQVTVHSEAAMAFLNQIGCTGAMAQTHGDYLFVVSAISNGKNNAWLERSLALTIQPRSGGARRHLLSMHFVNRAPVYGGYIPPFYDDYLRIFVPEGTAWIGTTGGRFDEQVYVPLSDRGYAEIGGHIRTIHNVFDITVIYDVPARHGGTLVWERQSGTADDPVTVTLEGPMSETMSFVLDRNQTLSFSRRVRNH